MSEFSAEASLTFSDRSISRMSKQLEDGLNPVSVDLRTGGSGLSERIASSGGGVTETATTAIGTRLSGMTGSLDETLELDQERNTYLSEILEATERTAAGGGGGGSVVSSMITLGGVTSMLSGSSLSSMLGTASLSTLVSKVSLSKLLKGGASLATLITTGVMAKNLIEGKATLSDVIQPLNDLGDLMTGPVELPELIETGAGIATFVTGGVSIAKFIGQSVAASKLISLAGSSLAPASSLVATGTSFLLPAAALVTGTIAISKLIDMHGDPGPAYDDTSGSSWESEGAQEQREWAETVGGPGGETLEPGEGLSPSATDRTQEIINQYDDSGPTAREMIPDSSSSGGNKARESSRPAELNYTSTINADLTSLERKIDQDLREFRRRIDQMERSLSRQR